MRILFVALSKETKTGARYTEEIIRQALSERHEVEFLYPNLRGDARLTSLLYLSCFGYLPLLKRGLYDLVFTSDNFVFADVVYVQPPAGQDAVLTWDEMLFTKSSKGHFRLLPALANSPLKTLISAHAQFITNSNYSREVVRRNFGKDAFVIYPPVPTHLYQSLESNRENLIVTISGLNPRKNLGLIAEVGIKIPEAKFILLGYYHKVHVHILEHIQARFRTSGLGTNFVYVPSCPAKVKAKILSRAKVYFHPTPFEPFGISIAEGMAAGCIPVTHDSGGPCEFVPGEWRYRSVEDAIAKIRYALETWNIRRATEFRSLALRFEEGRFRNEILDFVEEKFSRSCRMAGKLKPKDALAFSGGES
ncbi:MAG TPA: glycosyltransferase [Dehalococcoidia bacterium]|nr:glycosyltransferase [Dehalococcoidia bacterium]